VCEKLYLLLSIIIYICTVPECSLAVSGQVSAGGVMEGNKCMRGAGLALS
jgi:hypothetical protein